MGTNETAPAFDGHADSYEADLQRGLSLSGEGKEYFVNGRVERLKDLLHGIGHEPKRILDFGCGTGGATESLQTAFPEAMVIGTDPSDRSLEVARARTGATFVPFGAFTKAGPFDLCYCNGVFHHIAPGQRQVQLGDIRTAMSRGGRFALFENNPLNPGTHLVMRRIPFDRDAVMLAPWEARDRVRSAGFVVEVVDYLFYFPKALSRLRPLEDYLHRLPLGAQYLVLARA